MLLVALALRTGIPASVWAAEPPGWVDVALELIDETDNREGGESE